MGTLLTHAWLPFSLFSALILAVVMLLPIGSPVARRVFVDFVFLILLPLGVLFGWAIWLLSLVFDLPDQIWQALIAGLVIASGWLTTAIFNELGKARTKAERLRDYHKAIYAEIGAALQTLWDEGRSQASAQATLARMRDDPDFVPFIPREHHDRIFGAIMDKIDVLPRQTIDAIVAYYSLATSIQALAEDMRGERFQTLSQDRRIAVYEDFLAMRVEAFKFGQFALRLIKAYSEGGAPAVDALLNSPDAGPSGPSRGSA